MSIAWLWYYTDSVNPVRVDTNNEQRAFAVYARWRAFIQRAGSLIEGIRAAQCKRVERRALLALSDHLLEDIGMFRSGGDIRIEEKRQPRFIGNAAPISSKVSGNRCIVLPGMNVTSDTADAVTTDNSSRAA